MLLARFAPVGSQRYERLAEKVKSFDKIIEWLPLQLFAIWTIFVAGMAAGKAQLDRYYYWDWSDWWKGLIGLLVITLIFYPLIKKIKIKELNEINWMKNSKDYIFYSIFGSVLFLSGWVLTNISTFQNISNSIICYCVYVFAILLVYMLKVENNLIYDSKAKIIQVLVAILFLFGSVFIGFINDDPVIATAALVSLPFLIVLLFGKHVKHLERAKFYPIFIFAMFVVSREAWFIMPLLLLFFVLRWYNYLRHQKVIPTFGVTHDQD